MLMSATALSAAALTLTQLAPAATADAIGVPDPADLQHGVDLRSVVVDHKANNLVVTTTHTNLRESFRTSRLAAATSSAQAASRSRSSRAACSSSVGCCGAVVGVSSVLLGVAAVGALEVGEVLLVGVASGSSVPPQAPSTSASGRAAARTPTRRRVEVVMPPASPAGPDRRPT